jgi:hypothetical protein
MGERNTVSQPPHRTEPSPPAITGLLSRSIPTAIALATPITDFQRQHGQNVETGCRGGTEGGEVTAEKCCLVPVCIAPRCRVEPYWIKAAPLRGTAAPRRRFPRRAQPWGARSRGRAAQLTACL